ncbi:MAG: glycosyltransferase family 2 protein [Bacteroidetes bacterium]|nr:glycosyltransferase family 2 protein [Bacteroidota bacterium]
MDVSIVIVNYNTFEDTCNCIQSIYEQTKDIEFEIIVVDNQSSSFNPQEFKNLFPNINLIISAENGGFAKGNNQGIEIAKGKYVLLLNPDTILKNNAIYYLWKEMEMDSTIGISTCHLEYGNGKTQFTARKLRTISWELLQLTQLYRFFPKGKREEKMLHHYFPHNRKMECDWVSGACMLIRMEAINKLPQQQLSDIFFMYVEDALWCWQIKQLGYNVMFFPEGRIVHYEHKSLDKEKLKRLYNVINTNTLIFSKQYYKGIKWYIFASIYLFKQKLINIFR